MNEIHNAQSTTEELIVAYLDGELVRKELEIELFDRLATMADARHLLREHLVMRGAIKQSLTNERFQLSDDLDARTRARLEQILHSVTTPAVLETVKSRRVVDAPAIAHNAAERRLQQWVKRPVALALLLLLTVGTTWYATRSTMSVGDDRQIASNEPKAFAPSINQPSLASPVTAQETKVQEPKVIVRTVVQKVYVKQRAKDVAQNQNNTSGNVDNNEQQSDPADVMISRRAKHAIENSNTIVITEDDRI